VDAASTPFFVDSGLPQVSASRLRKISPSQQISIQANSLSPYFAARKQSRQFAQHSLAKDFAKKSALSHVFSGSGTFLL